MIGALLPLIITNVAHMVLVKRNGWAGLSIPIHQRAFGANKTWRGVVFVSVVNAVCFGLINFPGGVLLAHLGDNYYDAQFPDLFSWHGWDHVAFQAWLGWIYGMAYVLFELPNSWIKRSMGIAPGATATRGAVWFTLLDKTDSALGVSLVFCVLRDFSWRDALLFFITASALHFLFSWILYLRKIKKAF
ncbi:MAG: hypothetical protein ACKO67_06900 [Bacteroidota bacterium]